MLSFLEGKILQGVGYDIITPPLKLPLEKSRLHVKKSLSKPNATKDPTEEQSRLGGAFPFETGAFQLGRLSKQTNITHLLKVVPRIVPQKIINDEND